MKKSSLLVALTAASLVGGVALAQTQPYGEKPQATGQPAAAPAGAEISMTQLDKNKDGAVDKQEARASTNLPTVFDKADTNKDGKLDAAELNAAASMAKNK